MTWSEFCIRAAGYHIKEKKEWLRVREIGWASLIGPHINPKKLPKSKREYMDIRIGESESASDSAKELLMKKIEEYNKKVNNGKQQRISSKG